MQMKAAVLAAALILAPLGTKAADLVVWWEQGPHLADIPREWDAFWSFWCDQVQPAVREALGRDDVWGVGLPMSAVNDTGNELEQFQLAYDALWLDGNRSLQVDDPKIRAGHGQGAGGLHADLAQGLHAAQLDELDQRG
jgi:hypothetical protein